MKVSEPLSSIMSKSAALNTVSGVNMTPRRQLLKIKGLSEAKVEKIKVRGNSAREVANTLTICVQEAVHKMMVSVSHNLNNAAKYLSGFFIRHGLRSSGKEKACSVP